MIISFLLVPICILNMQSAVDGVMFVSQSELSTLLKSMNDDPFVAQASASRWSFFYCENVCSVILL